MSLGRVKDDCSINRRYTETVFEVNRNIVDTLTAGAAEISANSYMFTYVSNADEILCMYEFTNVRALLIFPDIDLLNRWEIQRSTVDRLTKNKMKWKLSIKGGIFCIRLNMQ